MISKRRGFSDLLFILTIAFLFLAAGVATAFGQWVKNRQVPQEVICIVKPENPSCRRSQAEYAWTLSPAEITGSDVTFFFSPSSGGNISLQVVNSSGDGQPVFDSGLIVEGVASIGWKNVAKGNYTAVLKQGNKQVSNIVSINP